MNAKVTLKVLFVVWLLTLTYLFSKEQHNIPIILGVKINTEDINKISYTTQSLNGLNRLC